MRSFAANSSLVAAGRAGALRLGVFALKGPFIRAFPLLPAPGAIINGLRICNKVTL
jgi:hypothetical protein